MTRYRPTAAQAKKIAQAKNLLQDLNFDAARTNDRSALVLLALAQLPPDEPWSAVRSDALLGIRPVMDWMREHYGKSYAENSRETIRRFTMHQFVDAGLVALNPDNPDRPTNSPDNVYQLVHQAGELLKTYGTDDYQTALRIYLELQPGLRAAYAAARELHRIPVTLPDTHNSFTLSPGGQNILVREMIEEFCPRFTPGGNVLYVGDAASKTAGVFERHALSDLDVTLDSHGKMPDLIVYMPDRNWLVLLEAASSHGPVDSKRHHELKNLFASCTAGLVFVSCFPSRTTMRKYLADIAWETEVWCSDNPDHLIHFNGERFLGPYG